MDNSISSKFVQNRNKVYRRFVMGFRVDSRLIAFIYISDV